MSIHVHLKRTSVSQAVQSYATARTIKWAGQCGPSRALSSQNEGGLHRCCSDAEGICASALCSPQPSCPAVPPAPRREKEFVGTDIQCDLLARLNFSVAAFRKGSTSSTFFLLPFFLKYQSLVIFCVFLPSYCSLLEQHKQETCSLPERFLLHFHIYGINCSYFVNYSMCTKIAFLKSNFPFFS